MPKIKITDDQAERLEDLQGRIAAELVGPYGTVRPRDAIEYLLDSYAAADAPLDPDAEAAGEAPPAAVEGVEDDDAEAEAEADDEDGQSADEDDEDHDAEADDGAAMLDSVMQLMDQHDDKWWQEDSGDSKYVVELPDGSTEAARTQDDVRALLFKHYR